MSLPEKIRDQLKDQLWIIADQIDWLALGPSEKSRFYENWTKDPQVGGILQRYMPFGQIRVYLKDSLLKDYPRARRADHVKPFLLLGIEQDAQVKKSFIKPHGRQLIDGRIICWGRAADWKTILMAVFERTVSTPGCISHAVVLTESSGKFADPTVRQMIIEASSRLLIDRLVWAS